MDTWASSAGLEGSADNEVFSCSKGLKALKEVSDRCGIFCLVVDHFGKAAEAGITQRQRRGRGAARRRRRRLHALRRLAAPGRGPRPAAPGAPGLRPLRHAAGRLVLSARQRVDAKGGANSFYAIDYAARMAMEMGADVVKLNMPKINPDEGQGRAGALQRDGGRRGRGDPPRASSPPAARWWCSPAAPRSTTRPCSTTPARSWRRAARGVIFGRNVWQREWNDALEIIEQIKETLLENAHAHPVARRALILNSP